MALCEMCGKEANLLTAEIEGGELQVCSNCAKYGEVKKVNSESHFFRPKLVTTEGPELRVVANFPSLILSAREKKGMNREDFARCLNEKESIIAKWEQGTLKPGIGAAKRLGHLLGLRLLEKDESDSLPVEKKKSDELTLGDFIKVRKRK